MFKRFLVLDLYHPEYTDPVKEWIDVKKEMPKDDTGIYKVRLGDERETAAYYCRDQCEPMMKYIKGEPSCWWDKHDKVPLYDVTHWGKNE